MRVVAELKNGSTTLAFQEEVAVRVLFLADSGEHEVTVPNPLQHPDVLEVRLLQDGHVEDRSPQRPARPPALPVPQMLKARTQRYAGEMNLVPPPAPGAWRLAIKVRLGERTFVAPELQFTVLEPKPRAIAAGALVDEPGGAARLLQLFAGGILTEHQVIVAAGDATLTLGKRVEVLDDAVTALVHASALPGVEARPPWILIVRGDEAVARRTTMTSEPARLRTPVEPEPVWIGRPLVAAQGDQGLLLATWAVGPRLHVARFGADGKANVEKVLLPGTVRGGAVVGHPQHGFAIVAHVTQTPQPLPRDMARLGSVADADEKLPHADFLYLVTVGADPKAKPAGPTRVAALPAGTLAFASHSGKADAPPEVWGVERQDQGVSAWVLPVGLGASGAAVGEPARRAVDAKNALGVPVALTCPAPARLRLAFVEPTGLLVAETSGRSGSVRLDTPPDFVAFTMGRMVVHDARHGLLLVE